MGVGSFRDIDHDTVTIDGAEHQLATVRWPIIRMSLLTRTDHKLGSFDLASL
jgi:hypothetical protein